MKKQSFNSELKAKSAQELQEQTKALREELMKTRFRAKTMTASQPTHKFSEIKKNLARTLTEISQRRDSVNN